LPLATPDQAAARTAEFLKLVNVSTSNVEALYQLPLAKLTAAAASLGSAASAAGEKFSTAATAANNPWRPVVDGRTVLYEPTQPTAPSDVPLLIGTTLDELYGYALLIHPEYAQMGEQQARELVRGYFGAVGDQVYDVYARAFPHADPFRVSGMARAMGHMRAYAVKLAQHRAAVGGAPTYLYWFQWQPKILGDRLKSFHALETPLEFLNSDTTPQFTGATVEARMLSEKIADVWLSFARRGNPNIDGLPPWAPVTANAAPAMVFDDNCRIDHGTDMAAIDAFWKSRYP